VIVCHCHRVNDRAVREAVEAGALDVEDVGAHCGAGTRCGSCRPTIGVLLATLGEREPVDTAA
jgi:bacterioferritin-associated ferredoxin